MEQGPPGEAWVCGDMYTIADMAIMPWILCLREFYGAADFLDLDSYQVPQARARVCVCVRAVRTCMCAVCTNIYIHPQHVHARAHAHAHAHSFTHTHAHAHAHAQAHAHAHARTHAHTHMHTRTRTRTRAAHHGVGGADQSQACGAAGSTRQRCSGQIRTTREEPPLARGLRDLTAARLRDARRFRPANRPARPSAHGHAELARRCTKLMRICEKCSWVLRKFCHEFLSTTLLAVKALALY